MDIDQALNAFTMLGARWVLWLLVALSVIGVTVAIERAVFLATSRDDVGRIQRELRRLLIIGDLERARRRLEESPSFEARIAAAGLQARGAGSAEERMAGESALSRLKMEQSLTYLGTLGSNAPFVGLLGTVIGIIGAFHELGGGLGQVSSGLMVEIGEALVATAVGLLVALPAVASYNLFQRIIKTRLGRADALGREVLAYFKGRDEAAPEAAE
ncbi:MAG: MotA/TolQ/ExbB proton channel family protein [Polyangiaceae bacterium]|nr:MotA/TolQ/ExbB proton channel family protein [Polyangiaceae bacterium]